jgi:ribonuclease HII
MYEFELAFREQGYLLVAGLDEAGRGPIAGPVTAAAVILNPADPIAGLNDSKQLSAKERNRLAGEIHSRALAYAVVFIDEATIDAVNIYQAAKMAMLEAVKRLPIVPTALLTDAMPLPETHLPFLALIKGDCRSASIAAASILAKVERDRHMTRMDEVYPGYGFVRHKGYLTKEHQMAIETLGPSPIHRKTFSPIKEIYQQQQSLF